MVEPQCNQSTIVLIFRLLGELFHIAFALIPESEMKKTFGTAANSTFRIDIWNWMVWNTDVSIKGLEAFLKHLFKYNFSYMYIIMVITLVNIILFINEN